MSKATRKINESILRVISHKIRPGKEKDSDKELTEKEKELNSVKEEKEKAENVNKEIERRKTFEKNYTGKYKKVLKNGRYVMTVQACRKTPKIGRNDICACKSGKKYKICCGAK